MVKKTPRYTGKLAEGLKPIQIGLLMPEQQRSAVLRERVDAESAKLGLLLDAHSIQRGPMQWLDLCLALARDHVPGFQETVRRGRRDKWNTLTLWMLAGAMLRESSTAPSDVAWPSARCWRRDGFRTPRTSGFADIVQISPHH